MLRRRLSLLIKGLVITFVGVVVVTPAGLARAGEHVSCPPRGGPCVVVVDTPGQPGSGGSGGGGRTPICNDLGCEYLDTLCFIKLADPQPDKSDPVWEGHTDGAIYTISCPKWFGPKGAFIWAVGNQWFPTPPPGAGGPSPAVAAAQAINQLGIRGPDIGIAPNTGGSGLVGLPVWLWTGVGPLTWGPVSATASLPGISVTATARAVRIVWDMGDGHTVTCDNPGTPYVAAYGNAPSPTCGYRYRTTSHDQPDGRFTISGTTTWQVDWAGSGSSGSLSVTRASSTTVQINELQVVTS